MINKKRIVLLGLVFMLLCSVVLTGCNNSKANSAGAEESTQKEVIEIEFWAGLTGTYGEFMQEQTNRFNALHDDMKVNITLCDDYPAVANKIQLGLQSGQIPVLAQLLDNTVQQFGDAGQLEDINAWIKEDHFDIEDYGQGLLVELTVGKNLYGLPLNKSMPILYYNKNVFNENGIDVSRLETWEGTREVAIELVEKGAVEYGFEPARWHWLYPSLVWSNGGELSNNPQDIKVNSPEAVEALQLWGDMFNKDETAMAHYGGEGWAYWYATVDDVNAGTAAMAVTSSADRAWYDENAVEAVMFPKFEGKERGVPTGGGNISMLAHATDEEKRVAWEYMKFVTSSKETAEWCKQLGYLPVRHSAKDEMKDFIEEHPITKTAFDQLQYVKAKPKFSEWNQIADEYINKALDRVFVEKVSAKDALDEAQKSTEKLLKR